MKRAFFTVALAIAACVVGIAPASAATQATAYTSIDTPAPPNVPSVGPEAYAFKEVGDEITFAEGTGRHLNKVSVLMSNWACEQGKWNNNNCFTTPGAKYTHPVTLTIYDASSEQQDGTVTPGDLLTRATKTFSFPYRPKSNLAHCRGADAGKWWNAADTTCYNGKASTITWNFGSLGIELPDTVVVGISYNTTSAGPHPIGTSACNSTDAGCAYDSLNVGLTPTVNVGSKPHPNTLFQNTSYAGFLCDGAVTGVFNLDSPNDPDCWTGYNPGISVVTH